MKYRNVSLEMRKSLATLARSSKISADSTKTPQMTIFLQRVQAACLVRRACPDIALAKTVSGFSDK